MVDNQNLNLSDIEHLIFNLLLNSRDSFDYPQLQRDAVDSISANLTDAIYDSLKQKSVGSTSKRTNLLKFVNIVCETREVHFGQKDYKLFLEVFREKQSYHENVDLEEFAREAADEFNTLIPSSFSARLCEFYQRKNEKQRNKVRSLEFIKGKDQCRLDSLNLGMQVFKNFLPYETKRDLINELLRTKEGEPVQNSVNEEKGDLEDLESLGIILPKLSRYETLEPFEINFLTFLFIQEGYLAKYSDYVIENFPFLTEKILIRSCKEIIKLKEDREVVNYFENLEFDPRVKRIRSICSKDRIFYCSCKSLIYQLYCYSYCNKNILKLHDKTELLVVCSLWFSSLIKMADSMPKADITKVSAAEREYIRRAQEDNLKRVERLKRVKRNNWITLGVLGATVLGIYSYTILSIKQETFLDDFEEPAKIIEK
ncbi:uncharacterized protein LOC132706498 [Cylas formicarius]|uniref:uncharacterized protein LOC132706498 n=1 Tax=Cylas formicarius TaxID=197179 RepID=UPI0029588289|nr:uncharacterized protein LOC132706498 [Cylas formicarius]